MTDTNASVKRIFICGSALRGQPDHGNLQDAVFVREAKTRPTYRLHSAGDGWHPAIYETDNNGISIPGEVYEMTLPQYEYLLANEPPNMYPAAVVLDDGEVLTAMLYPKALIDEHNWPDISETYGGWAAYKAAQAQSS